GGASALARLAGLIGDGRHPAVSPGLDQSEESDGSRDVGPGRRRAGTGDGRLYAVRCDGAGNEPDAERDGASAGGAGGGAGGAGGGARVELELLAEGEARTLPQKVHPPAGAGAT